MKNRHMQATKYVEIGVGNRWLIRTETEYPDGTEEECRGFAHPFTMESIYFRLWIGHRVLIWDSKEGMKRAAKGTKRFKCVIGFKGR